MVSERVVVKKKLSAMKIVLLVLAMIIVLVGVFAFIYVLPNLGVDVFDFLKSKERKEVKNPLQSIIEIAKSKEEIIEMGVMDFNEEYVSYVLFAIGADELHDPLFSDNHPKIEFQIDITYNSEIIDGEIITMEGAIEDEDIVISSTKEEIIEAILSEDMGSYMEDSVREGRTEIEMIADETELFSKGYLVMYKEITGEELGGEEG